MKILRDAYEIHKEIYEIIIGDSSIEKEINQLLNHINGCKKDEKLKDTIDRGLQIIA